MEAEPRQDSLSYLLNGALHGEAAGRLPLLLVNAMADLPLLPAPLPAPPAPRATAGAATAPSPAAAAHPRPSPNVSSARYRPCAKTLAAFGPRFRVGQALTCAGFTSAATSHLFLEATKACPMLQFL